MTSSPRDFYLTLILFLSLLYPLFHNFFSFLTINSYNYLFDKSPFFNLAVIGLKDILILIILFLLFLTRLNFNNILSMMLLILSLIFYSPSDFKQITLPFLIASTLYFNREKIFFLFERHKSIINNFFIFILITTLSFAWYEYVLRVYFDNHNLITINNEIKCSKYMLSDIDNFNSCIGSMQNYYKIDEFNNNYIILDTIFMPAGDSVSLSFILFFIIFFFSVLSNSRYKNFFILMAATSIFFTFSRFISIFTIFFLFYHFIFKEKKVLFFLIPLSFFLLNINYYFFSLFKSSVPSNIGHIEALSSILQYDVSIFMILIFISMIGFWIFLYKNINLDFILTYLMTLLLSMTLHLCVFNDWSFFGSDLVVAKESNFLKAIGTFGIMGIALYSYVLALLFYMLKSNNFYSVFIILIILLYQFISPYVISGFVIFFPAFTLAILSYIKNTK